MRFPPIIFLLLFLGSNSCTPNEQSSDATSSLPKDSVIVNIDSLKLDSIRHVRDGFVLNRFDIKLQDWGTYHYYHAYWEGFAGQRYNVLTCLVSAYGGVTLTSSLASKYCGQEHNRIEVLTGDSVYKTEKSKWHDVAVPSGVGNTECTMFAGEEALKIAEAIAAHSKEIIKVKVYRDDELIVVYELDEFSKKAFADCVPLNNLMKQIDLYDHSEDWVDSL
jgi:hypothetical protein